jgi:hypothetical protein
MPSSGMLRRLALVKTDVSEERSASIIKVTKLGELGTHVVFLRSVLRVLITANVSNALIIVTLIIEAIHSSKTSVLTRATWRNIPKDGILRSQRRGNLKSYISYIFISQTSQYRT